MAHSTALISVAVQPAPVFTPSILISSQKASPKPLPARFFPLHPSSAVGLDNTVAQIFVSTDFHSFGAEV